MSRPLVAPRYEPASAYHPPAPVPVDLTVDNVTLEDLLATPATREIVAKTASWALLMSRAEQSVQFLSNFTLRDAASYLPMDVSKSIAAADAALRKLPRSEWPANVR